MAAAAAATSMFGLCATSIAPTISGNEEAHMFLRVRRMVA